MIHMFILQGSRVVITRKKVVHDLILAYIRRVKGPSFVVYHLRINEALDVLQPGKVLLLLLHVHVVGDKNGEALADATLLEVALHQDLKVLIQVAEGRTGVQGTSLVVGLGRVGVGQLGVLEVEHVLNNDVAVLGGGLNGQGTLAGLLDDNVKLAGDGGIIGVHLVHLVSLAVLLVAGGRILVSEGGVVVGLGVLEVGEVGNGEGDSDTFIRLGLIAQRCRWR